MTPLLGTKNPSAPVGAKSGRDRRAARSLLPCAAWGGYGAAWATRAAASLFTIVHDCSPLFGIVQQKILRPEPVSPLRPHRQQACKVFTKHETRNTKHDLYASTKHETRNVSPFGSPWERKRHITKNLRSATVSLRPFAWPCAVSRGYGAAWAAWAATVPHAGNTACWVFTSHETRNKVFPVPPAAPRRATRNPTNRFSRITRHETRITAFLWRGYGAAWAAVVPRTGNTACWVFTNQEKRDTKQGFSPSLRRFQGEQPQARPTGFHESRDTRHESRPFCGAAMERHGRPSSPAPATRPVGFSRIRKNETRNKVFPHPYGDSKESNPKPDQQVFTNHETRDTNHGLFVARLWSGMGGHRPPHRQHGLLGFHESGKTRHETRFFPSLRRLQGEQPQTRPTGFHESRDTRITAFLWRGYGAAWAAVVPRTGNTASWVFTKHEHKHGFSHLCGDSKESNPKPDQQVFTRSRDTRHESRLFSSLPTFSHDFPAFPGNIRPPPTPQPIKGPPAVHRSGWVSRRASFVGNPTKMYKIPDPTGKCAKHGIRRSPRRTSACSAAANPE